jgi:hypothetical protein
MQVSCTLKELKAIVVISLIRMSQLVGYQTCPSTHEDADVCMQLSFLLLPLLHLASGIPTVATDQPR